MSTICIVGLGYIGLPTAAMFASHGHPVIGVDVNQTVVDILRRGEIHIEEPDLGPLVERVVRQGALRPQLEPSEADVFILAVPTPSDADHVPDVSYVQSAAESIVPYLRPGNLVVLESTSPPRTTVGLVAILERSGLKVGKDILLAHSPERVLPGRILIELVENDRVIGGHTPEAAEAGAELYRAFVKGKIHLTDATTAEMVKLMENTFRDVNIALANEFSRIGRQVGIDTHEAITLANFHPRVNILRPGPGVGGHCIAVDPWFIVDAAPKEAVLIRTARLVNDQQPEYVVGLVRDALADLDDPLVAVLGLAYKPDVDDLRESPSINVVKGLHAAGIRTKLHDAYATRSVEGLTLEPDVRTATDGASAILILTDHAPYKRLTPEAPELVALANRVLIDTRYCMDRSQWEAAGYRVHQLGVGAAEPPGSMETGT